MATRPTHCPDCGKSCTSHTGSYCQHCGTPLRAERPLKRPDELRHFDIRLIGHAPGHTLPMRIAAADETEAREAAAAHVSRDSIQWARYDWLGEIERGGVRRRA
jgi:hypothetical protein